jgi:hypothetical protein
MKSVNAIFAFLFVAISCLVSTSAFAPNANVARAFTNSRRVATPLQAAFDDGAERKSLTRESEPEEYFQT